MIKGPGRKPMEFWHASYGYPGNYWITSTNSERWFIRRAARFSLSSTPQRQPNHPLNYLTTKRHHLDLSPDAQLIQNAGNLRFGSLIWIGVINPPAVQLYKHTDPFLSRVRCRIFAHPVTNAPTFTF